MTAEPRFRSGLILTGPGENLFPGTLCWQDGRITDISRDHQLALEGPVIAPGFIDSHTHPVELGLEGVFPDLSEARTIADVLDHLRQAHRADPDGGILLGLNLDPDRLAEGRLPTRDELDRLAPARPVVVCRVDRHSAAAGSAALRLVGIEAGPDGLLGGPDYERAARAISCALPPDIIAGALDHASALAARTGTTTLGALDGVDDYSFDNWHELVALMNRQPIRHVPFLQTRNPEVAVRLGLPRVGGCILVDGSLGSHTAALSRDYSDAPGERGSLYLSDDELTRFLADADRHNLQTAVHAIGDRAVTQVLACHRRARTRPALRHRLEHAVVLNPELIAAIADSGLLLGVQPAFEANWGGPGRLYAHRLGPRHRQTNPFRSLLRAGIRLAGGSDAPITPVDPAAGIHAAVDRASPDERLTPDEALALFTTWAAFSLGLEDETGRLAPGLDADFVILDRDPRRADFRVLETWCRGRLVHPSPGEGR